MSNDIESQQPPNEPIEQANNEPKDHSTHRTQPAQNDPFHPCNLAKHRLSQDFESLVSVKPVIATIKSRKPNSQEFIRVRPGSEWKFETCLYEEPGTREFYMVSPELRHLHPDEIKPKSLVLTISRDSPIPYLWPLNLPSSDGRTNSWNESAIEVARTAMEKWVRRQSDLTASMYIAYVAMGDLPEPVWPEDLTMNDYLRLAFKDRFIDNTDHPCLQKLRGEI